MKIEVLVATMHQSDYSILEKMNIQSDAIIANQSNENKIEKFLFKNHNISFLTFNERGVGLNRNNALMRSDADICILADDDMTFIDGYYSQVLEVFNNNPSADVIIFNLIGVDFQKNTSIVKVGKMNYMKYGAARIAFRRKKVSYAGIYFNQNFGGGTKHSCGEDTIFLHDCLVSGLKIIHVPIAIAELDTTSESTWFKGYNEKFFYDRGVLHTVLYNKTRGKLFVKIFNLIYVARHRSILSSNINFKKAYSIMNKAVNDYKMY